MLKTYFGLIVVATLVAVCAGPALGQTPAQTAEINGAIEHWNDYQDESESLNEDYDNLIQRRESAIGEDDTGGSRGDATAAGCYAACTHQQTPDGNWNCGDWYDCGEDKRAKATNYQTACVAILTTTGAKRGTYINKYALFELLYDAGPESQAEWDLVYEAAVDANEAFHDCDGSGFVPNETPPVQYVWSNCLEALEDSHAAVYQSSPNWHRAYLNYWDAYELHYSEVCPECGEEECVCSEVCPECGEEECVCE
jgi:hypothetical protein